MSGESTILTDYKVTAYPTFILIEEGKVIAEQIGFPSEPFLRNMLEKSKVTVKLDFAPSNPVYGVYRVTFFSNLQVHDIRYVHRSYPKLSSNAA